MRQLITQIRQKVFQKGAFPAVIIYLERMVTIMKRFYTAESVTEGHPDKLCDLIADSILDACLKEDENSRVACEVLATKRNIIVAGEIPSRFEPQVFEIIKKVLESAGYEAEEIHMDALIHKQSPDIAGAVERSRERRAGTVSVQSGLASGAGDQGIMIGYACDETPQLMPMPVVLANRIVRELSASRRSGYITGILPDGKAWSMKMTDLPGWIPSLCPASMKRKNPFGSWSMRSGRKCYARHSVCCHRMRIPRS